MENEAGQYLEQVFAGIPGSRCVECPHCRDRVAIADGGWAYRYTQALLHLDRCIPGVTEHERQKAARFLSEAERLGDEPET
jgi:hypothetical protein